jgi:hypothetical protein
MANQVVKVDIGKMVASNGTSFYVIVTNNLGQEYNVLQTNVLDNALMEAQETADFFGIEPTPYIEDGIEHKPSMTLDTYKD